MIHFFAGDNQYLIKQSISKITAPIVKKYGEIAVEKLDAETTDLAKILDAINSPPFLIAQKCVIVQNANDKDLLTKIAEIKPLDSITVIVVISKFDRRASYFKLLQKLKTFNIFEKNKLTSLPNWVVNFVKDLGGNISFADANYLIERVGSDQILLSNELEKLYLFQANITRETINILTLEKLQSTTFQLLDSSFSGQIEDTKRLFNNLIIQKTDPQLIIGAIAWQLHLLVLVKFAGNKSANQIALDAKLKQYSVSKTQNLAKKITLKKLIKLVNDASKLDTAIKTKFVDPNQAILLYLIRLA